MRQVSTGLGLCVLGLCIVAYPLVDRLGTRAEAGIPAAGAVAAAALAQGPPEPSIVWYGTVPPTSSSSNSSVGMIFRAWSNGRIEYKPFMPYQPFTGGACDIWLGNSPGCTWRVFSDPAQGLTFDADLNFDEAVDGADLGELLAKWGPAPRNPVPPSDCPLALINP
jgi:hypothetical protein